MEKIFAISSCKSINVANCQFEGKMCKNIAFRKLMQGTPCTLEGKCLNKIVQQFMQRLTIAK
jgi:hypothetical protein